MRKHRPDFIIAILVLMLLAIGTVVIFTVGPRVAETSGAPSNTYIVHHLPMVAAAIFLMIVMALDWQDLIVKFSRKRLKKTIVVPKNEVILERFSFALLGISAMLCVLIALLGNLGVGSLVECNLGACRSFRIFGFGFQAVEMLKFAVMIYVASLIDKRKREGTFDGASTWVPIVTIIIFTLVVICAGQKDLGSTVVILFMILLMLFVSGASLWNIGKLGLGLAIALAFMVIFFRHRIERIMNFQEGYHLDNSLIGIGTGGIFGVGLGNSMQTVGYLPEALTDSIFSVICEAFGLLRTSAILLLYLVLLWRILKISRYTENMTQRLIAVAVFAWILAHVIINICGMTGMTPMKGITLSFLSYGGTSLVFTCAAVGIVIYISGWTKREEVLDEDSSSRRGERGTRHAGDRRYS